MSETCAIALCTWERRLRATESSGRYWPTPARRGLRLAGAAFALTASSPAMAEAPTPAQKAAIARALEETGAKKLVVALIADGGVSWVRTRPYAARRYGCAVCLGVPGLTANCCGQRVFDGVPGRAIKVEAQSGNDLTALSRTRDDRHVAWVQTSAHRWAGRYPCESRHKHEARQPCAAPCHLWNA